MNVSNVGLPWELCILFLGYVNIFLPNYTTSHPKIINPYIHCLQKNEWVWRKKNGQTLCQWGKFCTLVYIDPRVGALVRVCVIVHSLCTERDLVDSAWHREWYQLATVVLLVSWNTFFSYSIESNYFNKWRSVIVNAV
jgi:hypothetical protein